MSERSPRRLRCMFKDTNAFSGFAVPDVDVAQSFYGQTLGIETSVDNGLLTLHLAGGTRPTLAYPKPDHTPADYTILNFPVDDIEQDERGIMLDGGPYIAWFTDPGGNVLSVLQERE
jgi:predicted enzyme related to lactoylglutathione lyase